MFQNSGLSLEQAPPIGVIMRFFLVGSIFGFLGGILLAVLGSNFLNFSSSYTVILTHIFTIGMMSSFMVGALFQMLPVLAGAVIKNPVINGYFFQIFMISALILFVVDLIWHFSEGLNFGGIFLATAMIFIGIEFSIFLNQIKTFSPSAKAMAFAVGNLVMVGLLAIELLSILGGRGAFFDSLTYQTTKELHIFFGILAWAFILICAVSFQVVEMFYVTKAFPVKLAKRIPELLSAALIFKSLYLAGAANIILKLPNNLAYIVDIIIGLTILTYALIMIKNLFSQKRKVIEATILFWRVGIASLIVFSILFLFRAVLKLIGNFDLIFPSDANFFNLGMIIFFGIFIFSIIFAMVYKIVPFLVWFHLNAKGYFDAPMMHEVISPKYAKKHFYLHLGIIFTAFIALFFSSFWQILGILIAISFFILFWAIKKAYDKYKYVEKHGKKFDFPSTN